MDDHKGHRSRLRQRFLKGGEVSVADYELLEMLLYAAHPRGDVKPLAKKLLRRFKTLAGVMHAPVQELARQEGVGEAAIAIIKAAEVIAQKLIQEPLFKKPLLEETDAIVNYCRAVMGHLSVEQFRLLFLNRRHELILDEVQQMGTIDQAAVYPREIVKRALDLGASFLILAHNHPSGDPTPSQADIAITYHIKRLCDPLGVRVHDHIVIARHSYASLRAMSLI